jgi:hypothetical protein
VVQQGRVVQQRRLLCRRNGWCVVALERLALARRVRLLRRWHLEEDSRANVHNFM